jgi:mono-ADP-ribosyltransferase sirtuin 6
MKVDLKQYYPYIEFLNKVDVPNFSEENKIILARCTKVPLFDIFLYNKTDEIFQEKFNFLKYMTKTIEFNNENTNKLLHELVPKNEIIKYIEELKSTPYTLTKEDIKKQYNLEKKEYNEPESTLTPKMKKIAELLKKSKYCIVFTGAGISTSADIPDFRGPKGVWTKEEKKEKIEYGTEIVQTRPTFCHYALTELARQNYIKFLITTNMDGLHWRSGFPLHMYEELHGSAYTEHCIHCHKHYQRNTEVLRGSPDHLTDNFCDFCHKKLMDTIVNFNDTYRNPMEETVVEFQSYNADLVIILGTSCFVQPAASFPEKVVLSEIANAKKKIRKKRKTGLGNLKTNSLGENCFFKLFW